MGHDARFLFVNDEFCRIADRSRETLLASRLPDIAAPEDAPRVSRALDRIAGCNEPVSVDVRCMRREGDADWVNLKLRRVADGARGLVVVTASEIERLKSLEAAVGESEARRERLVTERRREEVALGESRRRLQLALEAARMGTWSWDPVLDVAAHDARALEILGGESSELSFAAALGQHLPPDSAERYAHCLQRVLDPAAGDPRFEEDLQWRRDDGERIWVQMTGQAEFEGEGRGRHVARITGTIVDITERKRNEEALKEANRQKDRFLATLAHELRNPLAPVYYAAELLQGRSREELDWARGVIERQVAHLTRLIDDLLDISRITRDQLEVRLEPIAVGDVVQAAIEASRTILREHGQELIVQLPAEPIVIHGDLVRLTQVLTNLLKNAAKFTARPGRVWLTVEHTVAEVSICVRDNGIGISSEELEHVFEMFYQSRRSRERTQGGLGVGLYLVRRLVELHGGTVRARSEGEGRGSDFIVRLPVARQRKADEIRRPAAAVERGGIHDNQDSADALAKLLRSGGNAVETAYEGWAALDAAASFRPEIVLLDLGMPTIDGYEVCRRIREQAWGKEVWLIALTGWGRAEDRARTRKAGFDDHLVKPVTLAAVESVLSARRRK